MRSRASDFPVDVLTSFVPGDATTGTKLAAFRGAFRHAAALAAVRRARTTAVDRTRELAELGAIGVALTTERDLGTLLGLILSHARRVTGARRRLALPRGARRERRAGAAPIRAARRTIRCRHSLRLVHGSDRLTRVSRATPPPPASPS